MYVGQAARLSGQDEVWYWPEALARAGQASRLSHAVHAQSTKGIMRPKLRLIAIFLALASFAGAQEVERFNFSIGGAGVFSKTSTSPDGSLTLKPTTSGAVI